MKAKNLSRYLMTLSLLIFSLSACGDDSHSNIDSAQDLAKNNPDYVLYDIDLGLSFKDSNEIGLGKFALAYGLKQKQPISFSLITDQLLEESLKGYETRQKKKLSTIETERVIEKLLPASSTSPVAIKSIYENRLEDRTKTPLIYNMESTSVGDILDQHRLQCYSGSILYEIIARRTYGAQKFRAQNHVLIFTEGHILPGVMIPEGDSYRLIGIESTAAGDAITDLGLTKNLQGAFRVVDAELFALAEIFKQNMKDPEAVVNQITQITAKKYGINLNQLHPDAVVVGGKAKTSEGTPFAFGDPNTPQGDLKRKKRDRLDAVYLKERSGAKIPVGDGDDDGKIRVFFNNPRQPGPLRVPDIERLPERKDLPDREEMEKKPEPTTERKPLVIPDEPKLMNI